MHANPVRKRSPKSPDFGAKSGDFAVHHDNLCMHTRETIHHRGHGARREIIKNLEVKSLPLREKQEFLLTTETLSHGVFLRLFSVSLCLRGSSLFGFGLSGLGFRILPKPPGSAGQAAFLYDFKQRICIEIGAARLDAQYISGLLDDYILRPGQ